MERKKKCEVPFKIPNFFLNKFLKKPKCFGRKIYILDHWMTLHFLKLCLIHDKTFVRNNGLKISYVPSAIQQYINISYTTQHDIHSNIYDAIVRHIMVDGIIWFYQWCWFFVVHSWLQISLQTKITRYHIRRSGWPFMRIVSTGNTFLKICILSNFYEES